MCSEFNGNKILYQNTKFGEIILLHMQLNYLPDLRKEYILNKILILMI